MLQWCDETSVSCLLIFRLNARESVGKHLNAHSMTADIDDELLRLLKKLLISGVTTT
jgi:hypothetical protein